MAQAYIGLGSNMQNPLQQIMEAVQEIRALPKSNLQQVSRFYQNAAIGPEQDDFINAAVMIDTQLTPFELLDQLQSIEEQHHRKREIHWGPRTLDLDILLYDQLQITSERLTIPHPFLTQRAFVLLPLSDINCNLALPDGSRIKNYLANCSEQKIYPLNLEDQPEISL